MFATVYGLVAVALLLGFARIFYELITGKFFGRRWKVYATRDHNPKLYWSSMILEILAAVLVTSVFVTNCLKELAKR